MPIDESSLPDDARAALEALDAELAAQETGTETTDAGDDLSTQVDAATPSGEETTTDPPNESWWDDQELSFGQSYGLSPEEVKEFGSRDDFRRSMRYLDRVAFSQAQQQGQQQATPEGQAQTEPQGEQTQQTPATPQKIELDPDEVDENLVNAFNAQQERIEKAESALSEMREKLTLQEQEAIRVEHERRIESFEEFIDGLGDEDTFGTKDQRSNLQLQNLEAMWNDSHSVERQALGMGLQGEFPTWVERAYALAYPNKPTKQQKATDTGKKILEQSKQKLGGGSTTKAQTTAWNGEPESDPVLIEAYKQMLDETGQL